MKQGLVSQLYFLHLKSDVWRFTLAVWQFSHCFQWIQCVSLCGFKCIHYFCVCVAGSAVTGPVAKECADLWPRIASNASSIHWRRPERKKDSRIFLLRFQLTSAISFMRPLAYRIKSGFTWVYFWQWWDFVDKNDKHKIPRLHEILKTRMFGRAEKLLL